MLFSIACSSGHYFQYLPSWVNTGFFSIPPLDFLWAHAIFHLISVLSSKYRHNKMYHLWLDTVYWFLQSKLSPWWGGCREYANLSWTGTINWYITHIIPTKFWNLTHIISTSNYVNFLSSILTSAKLMYLTKYIILSKVVKYGNMWCTHNTQYMLQTYKIPQLLFADGNHGTINL